MFLIFEFKDIITEVGRKFVMEHVFWMDRYFKAQLCLWAPPCPINLTQFWFRLGLNPRINSSITGKVVFTITQLEWLVAMHISFDKNTGGKRSKVKWLFTSNLISSILRALQGLGSRFTPGLQLWRKFNNTKWLVRDFVSNAQNRALKKQKMDSNPKYGPGHI